MSSCRLELEEEEEDPLDAIRQQYEDDKRQYETDLSEYERESSEFETKVADGQKKAEALFGGAPNLQVISPPRCRG